MLRVSPSSYQPPRLRGPFAGRRPSSGTSTRWFADERGGGQGAALGSGTSHGPIWKLPMKDRSEQARGRDCWSSLRGLSAEVVQDPSPRSHQRARRSQDHTAFGGDRLTSYGTVIGQQIIITHTPSAPSNISHSCQRTLLHLQHGFHRPQY